MSKLKVAIAVIGYENISGVEMYVYELSRQLVIMGHEVLITAPRVGGEIKRRSEEIGVKVCAFSDCPSSWKPDVLHLNEYIPACFALSFWPDVPAVATVHSQYQVEQPFISDRVNTYICIRPEVQSAVIASTTIPKSKTKIIYNGVDFDRFKPDKTSVHHAQRTILFVGTIDPLRKRTIEHLIHRAKEEKFKVKVVGKKYADYLDNHPDYVEVLDPTWNVEKYLADVTETAGILLGRTTIEGWVNGKPGWIYDVDMDGNIKSFALHSPPKDIDKFNIINVAREIEAEYRNAIRKRKVLTDARVLREDMTHIIAGMVAKATTQGMDVYELLVENGRKHEALQDLQRQINELNEQHAQSEQRLNRLLNNKVVRVVNKLSGIRR